MLIVLFSFCLAVVLNDPLVYFIYLGAYLGLFRISQFSV